MFVLSLATLEDVNAQLFGGDSSLNDLSHLQIGARAIAAYFLGITLIRLGKGRLLGRTTPLDFILGVVFGALLCQGIIGSLSLTRTFMAVLVLILLHWCATWLACRSHLFGNLVKGHAIVLVDQGVPQSGNMRKSHISEHDLLEELRLKANIDDLNEVKVAYKERSGEIGVVVRPRAARIIEVDVADGVQKVRIEV